MPFVAPWLIPPNYPQVAQAGAQLGLAARRQSESESESGDRLRLAYDQLAASEARAHEAEQTKRELARASLALRAQQAQGLDLYRRGQLDARTAAQALREDNMARLAEQFREREERLTQQFGTSQADREAREKRLGDQFNRRLEYLENRPSRQFLDPVTNALLNSDVADLRATERKLAATEPRGGFLGILGGNKEEISRLEERAKELRAKIARDYPMSPAAGTAPGKATLRWDEESGTLKPITE